MEQTRLRIYAPHFQQRKVSVVYGPITWRQLRQVDEIVSDDNIHSGVLFGDLPVAVKEIECDLVWVDFEDFTVTLALELEQVTVTEPKFENVKVVSTFTDDEISAAFHVQEPDESTIPF
jgi:hypothetical protein